MAPAFVCQTFSFHFERQLEALIDGLNIQIVPGIIDIFCDAIRFYSDCNETCNQRRNDGHNGNLICIRSFN